MIHSFNFVFELLAGKGSEEKVRKTWEVSEFLLEKASLKKKRNDQAN